MITVAIDSVSRYFSTTAAVAGNLKQRIHFAMTQKLKIGTHDGCFHCDEALACFMLKTLPQYKDAEIIRSRNKSVLETCDIVVDVGNEYNPSNHRYDHHMRDFNESVKTIINKPGYDWTIKLSSAGLIYCHFGTEIIKRIVPQLSDQDVENVFKNIYETFIKEIDGIDNGILVYKEQAPYNIRTDLSSRVEYLNVQWNEKGGNSDEKFVKAVELTGKEFMERVNYSANVWLPARTIVKSAIEKRFEVDPSGEIVLFATNIPWAQHLFAIEKELKVEPPLKYIIIKNDQYRIRCVPIEPGSFIVREWLPEAWAGLGGEQLERACGIKGAVFVHSGRFIGGHQTVEGALAMARKSREISSRLTNSSLKELSDFL